MTTSSSNPEVIKIAQSKRDRILQMFGPRFIFYVLRFEAAPGTFSSIQMKETGAQT